MLVISARNEERVSVTLNGKSLWLNFFIDHGRRRVRVGFDGPIEFVVMREKLTKERNTDVKTGDKATVRPSEVSETTSQPGVFGSL